MLEALILTTDLTFISLLKQIIWKLTGGQLLTDGNYLNFKAVLERKINRISAVRAGFELNNTDENLNFESVEKHYKDLISSAFIETDLGFSNALSAKVGVSGRTFFVFRKEQYCSPFCYCLSSGKRLDHFFSLWNFLSES